MNLYVGTSGYSYKEWKGTFYPKDLPAKQMLRYYGERFRTVEINNTFYRMPTASVLEAWAERGSRRLQVRAQGAAADHARQAAQGRGRSGRRICSKSPRH